MKKKLLINCVMLLFSFQCFCQPASKTDYLQKSKNQKTAAFILLGVGAALDIGGIITTISNANKQFDFPDVNKVNHSGEYALYIAGTACLMGSLTLFILSKSNKNKALSIGLDTKQFQQLKNGNLNTGSYPALTIKIGF
ncbi:MAG: hypothetical protein IPL50_03500 [Chitinophagaceae bacterium]|nr:hypothetical protein [Chitinophagaceae bacterium]